MVGVHAHPLSLYLPSRTKLHCTLQLRGQIDSPYFLSTLYVLCGMASEQTCVARCTVYVFKFESQLRDPLVQVQHGNRGTIVPEGGGEGGAFLVQKGIQI
jgi:hypothetical protein